MWPWNTGTPTAWHPAEKEKHLEGCGTYQFNLKLLCSPSAAAGSINPSTVVISKNNSPAALPAPELAGAAPPLPAPGLRTPTHSMWWWACSFWVWGCTCTTSTAKPKKNNGGKNRPEAPSITGHASVQLRWIRVRNRTGYRKPPWVIDTHRCATIPSR